MLTEDFTVDSHECPLAGQSSERPAGRPAASFAPPPREYVGNHPGSTDADGAQDAAQVDLSGVVDWFERLRLQHYSGRACQWCDEMGAQNAEDVVDYLLEEKAALDDFVQKLGLKPIEESRFRKDLQQKSQVQPVPVESRLVRRKLPPHIFESGTTYTGEWLGNKRDGHGVQRWIDGAQYEGQWLNDKTHGTGKFFHADGDFYDGEWKHGQVYGQGIYQHSDGSKYKGSWQNDQQHGNGIEEWRDGARYEGQYAKGCKHGLGKFSWADGSHYEGQFLMNDISGLGTYVWSDGRQYCGQWASNRMHGSGVFIWSDGRAYEGEYLNDKKHGHGLFKWPDGRQYAGQWRDGKQHGRGMCISATGAKSSGEWSDGQRINTLSDAASEARDAKASSGNSSLHLPQPVLQSTPAAPVREPVPLPQATSAAASAAKAQTRSSSVCSVS